MEACVKGCIIFVHVRFEFVSLLCCQIRRKWKTKMEDVEREVEC